jgi:pimeloyl-ACP methyl ester carboxylesterase
MRSTARDVYLFGPFRLDGGQGILSAGANEISLGSKAFETLRLLVENAGRIVSKRELIDHVWPDSHVEENNIAQNISLLRKTLASVDGATEYVQTLPRRGYRFNGTVLKDRPVSGAYLVRAEETPKTRYARNGDVNIAYQVIGDGPVDLLFVMGWVSHIEMFWAEPYFATFLRGLSRFARLILFDRRGAGLSDRASVSKVATAGERTGDVGAVMDAAGSRRAVLLGVSGGSPLAAYFAATNPERTAGIISFGGYARALRAPDYPWGLTSDQREALIGTMEREWGGAFGIETRAPSLRDDPGFRRWWATYLRMGASPGAAAALMRTDLEMDVREVLPSIRVPALIVHRSGDCCVRVEEGRFLAERIPGARYVELPGMDHLPFVGDQDAVLAAIERFLSELGEPALPARVLVTLLFIRTEGEARQLSQLDTEVEREISWFQGRKFAHVRDALVATFDGPARAIRCARSILAVAHGLGIRLAAGLHTGECEESVDGISGTAVEIGALLSEAAAPGEVVVSNTVRDLVAGSGLEFERRGDVFLGPRLGDWAVYVVG